MYFAAALILNSSSFETSNRTGYCRGAPFGTQTNDDIILYFLRLIGNQSSGLINKINGNLGITKTRSLLSIPVSNFQPFTFKYK